MTGVKWKGHTYRVQRHGPNQIASREGRRGKELDKEMGKVSEVCVEMKEGGGRWHRARDTGKGIDNEW